MRVFRTILGMVLLTVGLPTLLGGGGLWAVMQHRDPGGAFSGELQRLTVPGYAVVVPDIGKLLGDDAPFARIGDTQLRLSAATVDGRAFLGLAPSDQVARYLAGVPHTEIDAIDIGTGLLPVTTSRVGGRHAPTGTPAEQDFWTASGPGQISLTPGRLTDRPYSLVLMNPGGAPVLRLAVIAEVRPGWLNTTTWGLLTLGTLLVMAGAIVLAWPGRRREIVYVVEPSQVPELMHAIGAPLPLPSGVAYFSGVRNGGAHRPRTLADVRSRPPALPQFAWPPNAQATVPELPAGEPVTLSTATLDPTPGSGTPTAPTFDDDDRPGPGYPQRRTAVGTLTAPAVPLPGATTPAAGPRATPSATTTAGSRGAASGPSAGVSSTAIAAGPTAGLAGAPAGARTPAPGQPLSMLGETSALAGLQAGQVPARRGERRPQSAADVPQFQATAVGAWVAATAPERARQTEARAAARLAEAARRNAGKFAPTQPGSRNKSANVRIPIAAPRRDDGEVPTQTPSPETKNTPTRETTAAASEQTVAATPEQAAAATPAEIAVATPANVTSDNPASPAGEAATGHKAPASEPPATRFALHTGPAATDWTATALSRIGPALEPVPAAASGAVRDNVPQPPPQKKPEPEKGKKSATPDKSPIGTPPEWPLRGERAEKSPAEKSPAEKSPAEEAPAEKALAETVKPEKAAETGHSSIHAAEAAIPVLAEPAVGVPVSSGSPEPTQKDPGGPRRSVHTVETQGLGALPKKPSPVPTRVSAAPVQGLPVGEPAAPSRPGDPVTAPVPTEKAAEGRTSDGEEAAGSAAGPKKPARLVPGAVKATKAADSAVAASEQKPGRGEGNETGRARKSAGAGNAGDGLLARAQGRVGSKTAPARPAPAARRTPAAWIKAAERAAERATEKAAESVAARTGQAGGGTAAGGGQAGDGRAGGGRSGSGQAASGAAEGVPQKAASGHGADSRPLSYREEAAELLAAAAGSEPRRRRTVAGQNRSKTEPAGGGRKNSKSGETEEPKA